MILLNCFYNQIVANDLNGIDVDKMDYIARDCVGLGIKIAFDWRFVKAYIMKIYILNILHIYYYRRYIQFSSVIKCDDGKYHICPREKVLCYKSYR